MATFPSLRDGAVMRLTSTRETSIAVRTLQFEDDSEQRFVTAPPLSKRSLVLTSLSAYDLANVREFWRSMKGRFDTTWDILVDGVWHYNMTFDTDEFAVNEPKPGSFSLTLPCRQVRPN